MAIRCRNCGGRGIEKCPNPKCSGGKVKVWRPINPDAWWLEDCGTCHGVGTIPCRNPRCDGGWIR